MSKVVTGERANLSWLVWAVVLVLFIVGIVANYYYMDTISFAVRLAVGIVYFIILALIASMSSQGKQFWQFARDSRMELRKVVWPTRQETMQTTLLVLVMVVVVALVLWGIDSFLLWAVNFITGQRG